MYPRSMLLAATVLAAPLWLMPGAGQAEPISGLYVGGGIAPVYQYPYTSTRAAPAAALGVPAAKFQTSLGVGGTLAVGWGFGNGFRVELEGGYKNNRITKWYTTTVPTTSGGNLQNWSVMANALYEIPWDFGGMTQYIGSPYVGVGAGWVSTNLQNMNIRGVNGYALNVDDTSNSWAVQGIIGTAIPIRSVPGLAFTVDYRFTTVFGDQSFTGRSTGPLPTGAPGAIPRTGNFNIGDQFIHAVQFGVRYAFNAAPPPPPPAPAPVAAPAPAPSRTYLVFFDWDKADLTDRARQIIAEAAQNSTRVQYTRIEVAGHADHTGTAQYNQRLSLRRAQNVAAELVRQGVPQNAIDIQAFGFSRPLVPTGPGVREPQNRRVEIVLR